MASLTFAATGDSFITRSFPQGDRSMEALAALIRSADVRFTNLEVVLRSEMDGYPVVESGGTWASASPAVLGDLCRYGFNVMAWANNHTLDYADGGLEATRQALEQAGLVHVGAGRHLAEAAAPGYIETAGGRLACIAVTSTCPASWVAGAQRPDGPGRPGVNPLRYQAIHRVSEEELQCLKQIAQACGINAYRELMVKDGFTSPDPPDRFRFGDHCFQAVEAGGALGEWTEPDAGDLQRVIQWIAEARHRADGVVVSVHAHEMKGHKDRPADFLISFARQCIDAGAWAVVGHGPHLLRGVEIYRQRPIFYSLGNFIFQNETVEQLPADFFAKQRLGHDHLPGEALAQRSAGDTRGLGVDPRIWSSVVAHWRMEDGMLKELSFHPISLQQQLPPYRRGWPRLTEDLTVLEQLRDLSAPFGTDLVVADGQATWRPTA